MAVQTTEFSNKDVTYNRNKFIGGSDIAKIMGLSRWGTPLKLWAEKTGKLPAPDLSNVEAVEMGTRLEQFVADLFAVKTGKSVRRSPKYYQHPDYPYMIAHVDRLVTGTDELLECKTCSAFKADEWEGEEIPQEYILQVMWYLGITGRKIGHIAVLIGGQSFKYKQIEFDAELFATMVEAAKEFWGHVQEDTLPAVMAADGDVLETLYPKNSSKMIDLDITDENVKKLVEHHETKIKYLQEIKEHIKQLEAEKTEIETYLKYLIQESAGIRTPQYCVTWKLQKGQVVFDKETMLADGVYEKYASQTEFRRLNISKNKKFEVA